MWDEAGGASAENQINLRTFRGSQTATVQNLSFQTRVSEASFGEPWAFLRSSLFGLSLVEVFTSPIAN